MGIAPYADALKRNKQAIYDAATKLKATDRERALVIAMAMVQPQEKCPLRHTRCMCSTGTPDWPAAGYETCFLPAPCIKQPVAGVQALPAVSMCHCMCARFHVPEEIQ